VGRHPYSNLNTFLRTVYLNIRLKKNAEKVLLIAPIHQWELSNFSRTEEIASGALGILE
jgi:hypothetical protein